MQISWICILTNIESGCLVFHFWKRGLSGKFKARNRKGGWSGIFTTNLFHVFFFKERNMGGFLILGIFFCSVASPGFNISFRRKLLSITVHCRGNVIWAAKIAFVNSLIWLYPLKDVDKCFLSVCFSLSLSLTPLFMIYAIVSSLYMLIFCCFYQGSINFK